MQLLGPGTPTGRVGEKRFLEGLSPRTAGRLDVGNWRGRSGARGAYSRGGEHYLWGVLKGRVHCLPPIEVRARRAGGGGIVGGPDPRCAFTKADLRDVVLMIMTRW